MEIRFNVSHQKLTKETTNDYFVAGSKNYLIATFNFKTSEWVNPVFALFTYNGKTYQQTLGLDGLKDNQCYIPAEVIKSPSFEVSIYCGDLITTNAETVFIKQSGYTSNIINNPAEDTSTQLTKACQKYAMLCNQILQDCERIKQEIKGETL